MIISLATNGYGYIQSTSLMDEINRYEQTVLATPTNETATKMEAVQESKSDVGFFGDGVSTIGFFINAPLGIGLTGEYEWKQILGFRRSLVLNLGVRNKENGYGTTYSTSLGYLFHNGDYDKSWYWSYFGISLALLESRAYAVFPLGFRMGQKELIVAYIELTPALSDTKSLIGFGFGLRTRDLLLPKAMF